MHAGGILKYESRGRGKNSSQMPHLGFRINFFLITELFFEGFPVGESGRKGLAQATLGALGGSRAFENWTHFLSQEHSGGALSRMLAMPSWAPGIYSLTDDLNAKAQQNVKKHASPS